jgi:hypothetical protein
MLSIKCFIYTNVYLIVPEIGLVIVILLVDGKTFEYLSFMFIVEAPKNI